MPRVNNPADLTYEQLNQPDPAEGGGLIKKAGQAANEFVCGIYQTYPYGLLNELSTIERAITGKRALLDRMCRPLGKLPTPFQPLFKGGQCKNVQYEAEVNYSTIGVYGFGFREDASLQRIVVYGPITGIGLGGTIILTFEQTRVKCAQFVFIDAYEQGPNNTFAPKRFYVVGPFQFVDNRGASKLGSVNIRRLDNQPDSCGDPAPKPAPSIGATVNFNTTNNLTIAPNVVIPVAVTLIPTLIAPVSLNFRPEINVNVGGINVNFGLDGVRFSDPQPLPPGDTGGFDPRPDPPDPIIIDDSPAGGGGTDLTPVLDKLKELKDEVEECCDRYHPFSDLLTSDYDVRVLGTGSSGTYNLPSKAYRVVVTITNPDSKGKSEAGINGPNVLYAGWGWFKSGGGMLKREPMDSPIKAFDVPDRCDGTFAFTLRDLYNASVVCYFSKK